MEPVDWQSHTPRMLILCGNSPTMCEVQQACLQHNLTFRTANHLQSARADAESFAPALVLASIESLFDSASDIDQLGFTNSTDTRLCHGKAVCNPMALMALGSESEFPEAAGMVANGLSGFTVPEAFPASLQAIFTSLDRGEIWVSRRLLSSLVRKMVSRDPSDGLTPRENEILRKLVAGQSNREIADALFITKETVRWHLRSAYAKLGVHDRDSAARILNPPPSSAPTQHL